jgi:hypothetical protein
MARCGGPATSATHHPDVFPLFLPQTGCERFDWFAHELHAAGAGDCRRLRVKT